MITISGREFTNKTIEQIKQIIEHEPDISRRQLSLRVCEIMGWRNKAGKLQEMSCRKAILQMHRKELIQLPELKREYAFQNPSREIKPPPISPVEGYVADLGTLELVRVVRGKLAPVWRGMLDEYHYLKSGPLCGAQVRYLVRSEAYGWVGALSFSACALQVKSRDAWIGWSDQARKENLNLIVNNSRFLIPPMVKVKDLASHVLSMAEAQLPDDWEQLYGYRPVMLETYVERGRFKGSCYAGAGWLLAGGTSGRGRRENKKIIPKDIYLKPLVDSWRQELCSQIDGAPVIVPDNEQLPPRDWVEEELGRAELGDRRLTARLLKMTGQFYEQPQANIPQSCGSAKAAKAAYRFLDNPEVHWDKILHSHYQATADRIQRHKVVLVPTDSSTLDFSTHLSTRGLGPICQSEYIQGMILHDTMSFTEEGTPLGLLDVQCWARSETGTAKERHSKPIEEKESYKWIKSYQAVSAVQRAVKTTTLVMVADREGDIHELFTKRGEHRHNAELLVRAERTRNRKVIDKDGDYEYLWTILENQPVISTRKLMLPAKEEQPARQAELEVRVAKVTLKPPKKRPDQTDADVWAVYAIESDPPEEIAPLEWMLLTTVETTRTTEALKRLEWYARRWGIEVYHRILKSGCNIERRQLANTDRLRNCLAIDMVVAWRIYHLTMQGRETPELSCEVYFSANEWKALTTFVRKTKEPPPNPPTLNEAVAMLGKLGGHLGRTGDTDPGSEVLWRGMTRLADVTEAYRLYK